MRRIVLPFLALLSSGCAQMSVGLWADSDRGERSVAAIASIELPPEPTAVREARPAVKKAAPNRDDEWDVPDQETTAAPPVIAKIPSAQKPEPEPAVETWAPTGKSVSPSAEFGGDAVNYRWVQGRVSYVKISGNRVWKIRFAPYDQSDKFGGSFILDGSLPKELKDGDLVRVEGTPNSDSGETRNVRFHCSRVVVLDPKDKPKR
jgi:hypothetical protein